MTSQQRQRRPKPERQITGYLNTATGVNRVAMKFFS